MFNESLLSFIPNLFNGFLQLILVLFLKIVSFVASIILAPIVATLNTFVPDMHEYFILMENFISDYLLKGVAFVREVFFNMTGFPRGLFNFLIAYLVFKFGLMIFKSVFRAFSNAYYIARGSK